MVALAGLTFFLLKKGGVQGKWATALCLFGVAMACTFCILIDVVANPNAPSAFVPMLFVSLPLLFIIPFRHIYCVLLFFACCYIAAVVTLEPPLVAQHDIFCSLAGLTFSIPVAQVTMRLRIQDHEIRTKYQQMSTQDALSGILNKKACEEATLRYLSTNNPAATCTLLILDVDNFKMVNDQSGHYTGDALLRIIGQLLSETFQATDIIGRFGGDEFMVLVKGTANHDLLAQQCQLLQSRLRSAAPAGAPLQLTCSIGSVLVREQTVAFESLFRQADDALYQAKRAGKDKFVIRHYRSDTPHSPSPSPV